MNEERVQPRAISEAEPLVILRDISAEVFFTLAESRQPQHLIDGLVYALPSPDEAHEELVLAIAEALAEAARTNGGKVVVERECWLGDSTVIAPDVAYLVAERAGLVGRFVRGAPDLVVEVLSPGTRAFDTEAKFSAYEKSGVRELWLVDPTARTVTVIKGDGVAWASEATVAFGEGVHSSIVRAGAGGLTADSSPE